MASTRNDAASDAVYQPAPCGAPWTLTIVRRCWILHDAVTVLGTSIAIVESGDELVASPVHPAKTYRVPEGPVTMASIVNEATSDSLYQPDPTGVPYALTSVRRCCVLHEAVTVFGVSIVIVASGTEPVRSPAHPAKT